MDVTSFFEDSNFLIVSSCMFSLMKLQSDVWSEHIECTVIQIVLLLKISLVHNEMHNSLVERVQSFRNKYIHIDIEKQSTINNHFIDCNQIWYSKWMWKYLISIKVQLCFKPEKCIFGLRKF